MAWPLPLPLLNGTVIKKTFLRLPISDVIKSCSVAEKRMEGVKDRFSLVYAIFFYLSVGMLLPWNFFINVNGYWMYKFRTLNATDLNITGYLNKAACPNFALGMLRKIESPIKSWNDFKTDRQFKIVWNYFSVKLNLPGKCPKFGQGVEVRACYPTYNISLNPSWL